MSIVPDGRFRQLSPQKDPYKLSNRPLAAAFLATLATLLLPMAISSQEVMDLPGRDRALRVDEEKVFSVGSVVGDDWEMFSTVTGLAFDGDGNLYILDRQNFRVVKVGPQGEFITEMGRAGGGPGEFGMPMSFGVTPSGEVRVFDMGQQGFTVFNPDGSFQKTVPLAGGDMFVPNGGLQSLPGGRMVDGGLTGFGMTIVGGSGDELAVADSTTYTVKLVEPGQGVFRTLRRPFSPKAVTRRDQAAERERQLDEIAAREESGGGGGGRTFSSEGGAAVSIGGGRVSELLRARVEGMQFGEEIPLIAGMAVDWAGQIWVERTGQRIGEGGPIDLISSGGRYVGTVGPDEFRIPDAFGPHGLVAYIEKDEMDVPKVVVKRLTAR